MKNVARLVIVLVSFSMLSGCGGSSNETKLDALLQRPEAKEVDIELMEVVNRFHLAMRRGEYEDAKTYLSTKATFEHFSTIGENLYRFETAIMSVKIVGDDLIPWNANKYENPNFGSMAIVRVMALSNFGWQPIDFYIRDDAGDDPKAGSKHWKVLLVGTPDFIEESEF